MYDAAFAENDQRLLFEQRWLLGKLKTEKKFTVKDSIDEALQNAGFKLVEKTADELYPLFIYQKVCKEKA